MPRDRLIQLLDEVHEELEAQREAGTLDDDAVERLRDLDADIRSWLEDDADRRPPEVLLGPAERALGRFGADHPTLTAILNQVADALGKMGI